MAPSWFLGFLLLVFFVGLDRDMFKLSRKEFVQISIFIPMLMAAKYVLMNAAGVSPSLMCGITHKIPLWVPFTVWWEDMVFSAPVVYMLRRGVSKKFWIPIAIVMSLIFGAGHLYQGLYGALAATSVLFVFMWLAHNKGMLTLIYLHFLFDMCALIMLRMYCG